MEQNKYLRATFYVEYYLGSLNQGSVFGEGLQVLLGKFPRS